MSITESARIGLAGLNTHRLRTLLTTLGIVFGVAAVIAMLSIGEGAKRKVLAQFALMGIDNLLVIDKPAPAPKDDSETRPFSAGLTLADGEAVREVMPQALRGGADARHRDGRAGRTQTRHGEHRGHDARTMWTRREAIPARGRFLDWAEVDSLSRVCVLGAGLARDLFLLGDPVGERVKVGRDWYVVVGVMAGVGAVAGSGLEDVRDTARDLYLPVSASLQRLPCKPFTSELHRLIVQVKDTGQLSEATDVLTAVIGRRHRGVEDFRLVVPAQLIRQQQSTQRIFNVVMGAIAGISLLVGGIGIMNIMLASALERTREIGVRRAVGATEHDILLQFLLEAVGVSFLGGLIGVVIGFGLTQAIATYAGWPVAIAPWSVLLAFGVSAAVGIVFGYYPARRAARMSPIESLRYE